MRLSHTLSRCFLLLGLLLSVGQALPLSASAEGVFKEGEETTAPVAKPKPRHIVAKKAAPVTPAAPIPYTTYKAGPARSTTPGAAVSPAPVVTTDPPIVIAPAPILPLQPIEAPPPAPPAAAPPVATAPAAPSEISLKCDTRTTRGKKVVSSGTFYIDLFPSPVFPDQNADFKFLFADPAHRSLIRDTMCLDTTCTAEVSGTAYYLVNRVTRKGAALRITLDRVQGAFYAEEMGKHGSDHLGEQGYCTVQPLPNSMF